MRWWASVENVLRRLKDDRASTHDHRLHPIGSLGSRRWRCARHPVRRTIIVLVFLPLFALPGIEGAAVCAAWAFAFIVSTLASLVVSVTVTPVLAFYLLPRMKNLDHGDTRVVAWLKTRYPNGLQAVLAARARWLPPASRGRRRRGCAVLPDRRSAAVQRRHAAHRHAAQPGVTLADPPRGATGRGAGAPGARGHARWAPQRRGT